MSWVDLTSVHYYILAKYYYIPHACMHSHDTRGPGHACKVQCHMDACVIIIRTYEYACNVMQYYNTLYTNQISCHLYRHTVRTMHMHDHICMQACTFDQLTVVHVHACARVYI